MSGGSDDDDRSIRGKGDGQDDNQNNTIIQ